MTVAVDNLAEETPKYKPNARCYGIIAPGFILTLATALALRPQPGIFLFKLAAIIRNVLNRRYIL